MPSVDYSADFDWSILTVPEPMAMVRGQLGFSWMVLAERLCEIDDEAYLWEPAPGAWSLRPRDQTRTENFTGLGDWVLEWPLDGDPERMRTIAWLVSHLTDVFFERWEWTFRWSSAAAQRSDFSADRRRGDRSTDPLGNRVAGGYRRASRRADLHRGIESGHRHRPTGPVRYLELHVNRKLIHHGAEITFLLDLYRASSSKTPVRSGSGGLS